MGRDLTEEEKRQWLEANGQAVPSIKLPESNPHSVGSVMPSKTKASRVAELVLLEQARAKKLFKPYARIQASLDLHGMTQAEAFAVLEQFLHQQVCLGRRHVAIITGKGRTSEGVLRRAVPQWLELPQIRPFVAAIAHATAKKGGDGVLHVLLKQNTAT